MARARLHVLPACARASVPVLKLADQARVVQGAPAGASGCLMSPRGPLHGARMQARGGWAGARLLRCLSMRLSASAGLSLCATDSQRLA